MKNPETWTRKDLHSHLQKALDIELWTIPLYLTAMYSIRGLKDKKPADYPDAAKLIFSVAIQEMLHIELVSNLCNALGFEPKYNFPVYSEKEGIPFLKPEVEYFPGHLRGYKVKPQALGVESLKLFCAIELPHPKSEVDWETQESYASISEMYEAIRTGVVKFWDVCYVGETANIRQKDNFNEYHRRGKNHHGFSQVINSLESAILAIEAIVEQGEGASFHKVPLEFRPPEIKKGDEMHISWFRGDLSHYYKFSMLLANPEALPDVYPIMENPVSGQLKEDLVNALMTFLRQMETDFNSPGPQMSDTFWTEMGHLTDAICAVWESGAVPEFN